MKTRMTKILFDNHSDDFVLDVFNKSVDEDGFIIERKDNSRVETPEGQHLQKQNLAVLKKGSEKFIAGDLTSLMKLSQGEL